MKYLIITIHGLLVVLAYTAWLWVDWRIVGLVAALHLAMLVVLKGCPLSHLQFPGDKDHRFYEWWLGKIGVDVVSSQLRRKRVRIFMQYVLPVIITALAMVLQLFASWKPLLGL